MTTPAPPSQPGQYAPALPSVHHRRRRCAAASHDPRGGADTLAASLQQRPCTTSWYGFHMQQARLAGMVVLLTGAGHGMGREVAGRSVQEPARLRVTGGAPSG